MTFRRMCLALAAAFACILDAGAGASAFELRWPVACTLGEDCVIQNYVDRDPSRGARDYACGSLTYDGHTGTDIRLPTTARQKAGVDVLAPADGAVLRVRDGIADVSVRSAGAAAVKDKECGNGVVIAHESGYETQYCHLARGSVRVRPGDKVEAGEPIGRIGLSGATEFPHLHMTVRRRGAIIDPFAADAPADACAGGASLWAEPLRAKLAYRGSAVLNAGFAAGPATMAAIESGEAGAARLAAGAPALVAFARAIGLKRGDVQRLTVTAPGGEAVVTNEAPPLDRDKAQWMVFAGRKRPASGWPPGTYTAKYEVIRAGATALEETFSVEVDP
jgi:murein DD-endopeptidase MepM/ murein hydrolase activator NlpD